MAKVESIEELKNAQQNQAGEQRKVRETASEYYSRIASKENREKNLVAIGEFALQLDFKLEELILGMADYCTGMIINSIAENLPSEEELIKAENDFNDTRIALAEALNGLKYTGMGDNILAMLSLVSESIIILSNEHVKTGVEI